MRMDAPEASLVASAAIPSVDPPNHRNLSSVTGVTGAGPLPTLAGNHLKPGATGTLSPLGSGTARERARRGLNNSGPRKLVQCRQQSAKGESFTARGHALLETIRRCAQLSDLVPFRGLPPSRTLARRRRAPNRYRTSPLPLRSSPQGGHSALSKRSKDLLNDVNAHCPRCFRAGTITTQL